jgi:hypothetical protein
MKVRPAIIAGRFVWSERGVEARSLRPPVVTPALRLKAVGFRPFRRPDGSGTRCRRGVGSGHQAWE